ncbi:MAG: hypothetical protein V1709_09280, partial [Planctomycetota bacterium]
MKNLLYYVIAVLSLVAFVTTFRKFLNNVRTNMFIFTKSIIYGLGLFLLAPLEAIRCQGTRIISRSFFFTVLLLTGLMFFLTGQVGCGGGGENSSDSSTPPATSAPSVITNSATNITQTSATLNGIVNPNGLDVTSCYFDYGTSLSYGITATVVSLPISGTSPISVTANVISLLSSTPYNFRVVATNAGGTTNGLNQTFTTSAPPPPPTCTTNATTNVTYNSATLNGTVNPNGLDVTSCYFDYGTSLSYGISAIVVSLPGSGTNPIPVTASVLSLSSSTPYNFRVVATNAGGTTNGLNQSFTTSALPPPTCTTNGVTNVIYNSATLNGTVNPNGVNVTSCYFDYGTTLSYGSQQNVVSLPGSGTNPIFVTANVFSLLSNTLYNFKMVATNAGGTTNGNNQTFTTTAAPTTAVDDYVWVANASSNNVTRILKSDSTTTNITVGSSPIGVAVDKTYCWVANYGSANITRITKSLLATTNITVGTEPYGIAVDETYCWVTNWGSNNVTRILKSDSTTTTIAVGTGPEGVAVDGTYCWVANYGSSNVTRILKADSTTTTIAVGTNPEG